MTKYDRRGASSRLRSFQYIPFLNNNGYRVTVSPLFRKDYLQRIYSGHRPEFYLQIGPALRRLRMLLKIGQYDLVWIEKELFPYLPAFTELLIAGCRVPLIIDYDDAIFHQYDRSDNLFIRRILTNKIRTVMRTATVVVVGNDYIANYAKAAGAREVLQVPTVVDHLRYSPRLHVSKDKPVIGWIGTPITQKIYLCRHHIIRTVLDAHGAQLLLVGAKPDTALAMESGVTIAPWSEDTEAALIKCMDIGIMPLGDTPWERGKCGYKLIQYMATGVPVIASPVGANVSIVNGAQCGILAETNSDWQRALAKLLSDSALRKRFGANGRKAVESTYSLVAQAPRILELFDRILNSPQR